MDKLDRYLSCYKEEEFDWANMNCGHFSSKWVLECEGFDPLAGVAFPSTPEGVNEVVKQYGSLADMISSRLGRGSLSSAFAIRGDIVMAPLTGVAGSVGVGAMIGICNGGTAVFLREGSGIITLRMRVASHAWRIVQ